MILEVNGQQYRCHILYSKDNRDRRKTSITIHPGAICPRDADNHGPCLAQSVLFGEAFCSVKDTFSRAVGRRIAMTNALLLLSRESRRQFWASFLSQIKDRG